MKCLSVCTMLLCVAIIASCLNEDQIEFRRAFTAGEVVYYKNCRNCHGDKGEGLSALMPPLTDTLYLKKNKDKLACIINYGLNNRLIIVNKKPYQNQMPPANLAPIEVAQVLTYVCNSFGNKQGLISLTKVTKDLSNCK